MAKPCKAFRGIGDHPLLSPVMINIQLFFKGITMKHIIYLLIGFFSFNSALSQVNVANLNDDNKRSAIPSYQMRAISDRNWNDIANYFESSQADRTKLGWKLHSHNVEIFMTQTAYSMPSYNVTFIWVCETGDCETPT